MKIFVQTMAPSILIAYSLNQ